MVIELVAGRLVAPALGVSLFTWTTVIGVVLGGIGLGNFVGGRIADRFPERRTLVVLLLLGALAALSIVFTLDAISLFYVLPLSWPIVLRFLCVIGIVFFVPTTVLGTITPVVIRLSLDDLARAGGTVGTLYALSLLGSIAGTFATGFYLIAAFGTRTLIAMVAGLLALLALAIAARSLRRREALLAGWAASALALSAATNHLASPCLRESNYYCIRVEETSEGSERLRLLYLDRLLHSYWNLSNPLDLVYPYEDAYAVVTEYVARRQPAFAMLSIGGGGFIFPYYVTQVYPQGRVTVAEVDPAVTAVARRQFALASDPPIEVYDGDGRLYLTTVARERQFDLIVGDAFNDFSVPYHLTTREFEQLVKAHLRPGGIYMANIIDIPSQGHFFRAFVDTMQSVFANVVVLGGENFPDPDARETWVIVGSDTDLSTAELAQIAATNPDWKQAAVLMRTLRLNSYLRKEAPIILSDDYVPTDNLLAPVFGGE